MEFVLIVAKNGDYSHWRLDEA